MKLNPPETAPKDRQILADVGYPWLVIACWNTHDEEWVYPALQACLMESGKYDFYYENERDKKINGWIPMPEIGR